MSKIEAGRTRLQKNDFDLLQMLSGLSEMFGIRASEKSLYLRFEASDEVPRYVRTDERKLRQVLINLLSNATKFTDKGGITLRAFVGERIDAGPENDHLCLVFEVEDTGYGIAPNEIDTLFKVFEQTETGQMAGSGTGLGLAISKLFVELMGGKITVHSTVNQGSIFSFYVLLKEVPSIQVSPKTKTYRVRTLAPNQSFYRILVVEDDYAHRYLLRTLLDEVGFQVREAINGREAIEIWKAWQPHLILMDMRLPEMDGYEATTRIKGLAKDNEPIIIAVSASAFEEDRSMMLAHGCDDFLRKPIREGILFERLASYLDVKYIYDMPSSTEQYDKIQDRLSFAQIEYLPYSWIVDVFHAAQIADHERLQKLLHEIEDEFPDVVHTLKSWMRDFRYDKIVASFESKVHLPGE